MNLFLKKWKGLLLSVCILVLGASITGLASDMEDIVPDMTTGEYQIILDELEYIYTGLEIRPEIAVAKIDESGNVLQNTFLIENEDYEVDYLNNIESGIATVVVTGIGEYQNNLEIKKEFTIIPADINTTEISLSYKSYIYNGKSKKPAVTVKLDDVLISNDNYEVKYSNNKEVGVAKVTVTGKNNLTGKNDVSFKIKLKAPTITIERSYNSLEIDWNSVTGADGYQVYRSTEKDSGYKRIVTVDSSDKTKYVDKNVKHNMRYYYKVRAYKVVNDEKNYSSYSKVDSTTVRVAAPIIEKISRVDHITLKINWEAVDGATGYKVYRSTSEDGEYEKIATLNGNDSLSYKDGELKCGRTYYYKIKAYRKVDGTKYHGSFSDAKKSYPRPAKVKISDDLSFDATKITLVWGKALGSQGYQIWRATSKDGEYTKVKTISSGKTVTYTDEGLSKSNNYYYKIRAYRKTDGKTIYGLFSDVYTKRKAGWRYVKSDGQKVKIYYNAKGQKVTDVRNRIGKQDSYYIKVNKQKCTVTVYAKDGDNGYIIPVVSFVCSPGQSTPVGTFNTPAKYRWHELMGPCWGQWNTRITGSFLFHSVFYNSKNNNKTLSVSAYNKLGTICSHGCVRLTAGDAKWIYDNCELGTTVTIYNSSVSGPFGKPSAVKLPTWHTWDPTDPNVASECDARGCH